MKKCSIANKFHRVGIQTWQQLRLLYICAWVKGEKGQKGEIDTLLPESCYMLVGGGCF